MKIIYIISDKVFQTIIPTLYLSHITFAAFIISFYMCQLEYILLSNETGLLPWLLSLPFCYYDRNQHTKLLQLKKTNFYSLFKNVVKAESHTLHSCKGQRKFIALLCKILNLNDKVNLIALSNKLVMKILTGFIW